MIFIIMNPNNYLKQRERALTRKIELVNYKGGKCEKCGYSQNLSALDFHHLHPEDKSFQLDSRHLSNTNIDRLKEEVDKCVLLCANCHRETHYPEYDSDNLQNLLNEVKTKNVKVLGKKRKQSICPNCGKTFDSVKGKIFCSNECRKQAKNYPSKETLISSYQKLKSWEKVANEFGLSRKIVRGIMKK